MASGGPPPSALIVDNRGAVDLVSMEEFDSPSFDADDESEGALPPSAQNFRERLQASDCFVICSPEYDGSMPGTLKNSIDWVSRARPQPFNERHGGERHRSPTIEAVARNQSSRGRLTAS